jgi:GAF domain-containing protein
MSEIGQDPRRERNGNAGAKGQPSSSDTGSSVHEHRLADQLSDLARSLQGEEDIDDTLDAIVHAAVGTVPGARHASISVVRGRREVRTRASTDELPRAVDHAQYDTGQGPCLDTLYEQETVRVPDLRAEQRWPDFARRAVELGMHSMLSVQLFVDGDDLGALNLHSEQVDGFGDESEHVALLFAAHAAVAMAGAQQQDHLRQALRTRELIGQATGVLIERFKITGDQAFRLLVRASQHTNRKLRDVAEELVTTGELAR